MNNDEIKELVKQICNRFNRLQLNSNKIDIDKVFNKVIELKSNFNQNHLQPPQSGKTNYKLYIAEITKQCITQNIKDYNNRILKRKIKIKKIY